MLPPRGPSHCYLDVAVASPVSVQWPRQPGIGTTDVRSGCLRLAEEVGFEPTVTFRLQRFSRPPVSTAHALLRSVTRDRSKNTGGGGKRQGGGKAAEWRRKAVDETVVSGVFMRTVVFRLRLTSRGRLLTCPALQSGFPLSAFRLAAAGAGDFGLVEPGHGVPEEPLVGTAANFLFQ
jgi:hypothetical protein